MSGGVKAFNILEGAQREASDPSVHAALSASAGTGKTHVLTARVLRLLLQGTAPESILCLTFTKAGASEMANRLAERLAHWVRLDDAKLRKELYALGEERDPASLDRARRLFAKVLDTPGGLRIQTIHSFAQSLLASFPAEAGISPGLRPIEGRAEAELLRQTLADLLAAAEAAGDTQLLADVEALSMRLGEQGAVDYLAICARQGDAIAALGPPDRFETLLRRAMELPDGTVEDVLAERCADGAIDCTLLEQLMEVNRQWKAATGGKLVAQLQAWLAADPLARAQSFRQMAAGIVRKDGIAAVPKAGQLAIDPDYGALGERLAELVRQWSAIEAGIGLARSQAAALRVGAAFAAAYGAAKRARGLADFNDLIAWTRTLLTTPGMGDWVRFKLDRRTDHVLVDEAQDTNADQWAIVHALAEEFFSGQAEADERHRTLFMVGDYKQAIYGFQGTDPRQFEDYKSTVKSLAAAVAAVADEQAVPATSFRDLSIDASFRSAGAILDLVNAAIAELGHRAMGLEAPPNLHRPALDRPGLVELWPPFTAEEAGEAAEEGEEGWIPEPVRLFADDLAQKVRGLLDEGPVMSSTGRPLSPGDILILVRSRSELAGLIVARLHARGVPVAGIDRLVLSEPLAVKDLLSAIAFASQPADDLNLAALLVSPLLGWDQDQLYRLARGREGRTLFAQLQRRRDEDDVFQRAHDRLGALLRMADHVTPSVFLETILSGPMQGRRALLERLGESARDPIEELLARAIEFERSEIPSLDRFLSWFHSGQVDVKRESNGEGEAVRVMTVHGAKGLEAPFVILADATHDPTQVGRRPCHIDLPLAGGRVPLLRPRSEERVEPFHSLMDAQAARDLEEHWRLLYVALTRAADRLVVAGVQPKRPSDASWHRAAERAFERLGASSQPDGARHWPARPPATGRKGRLPTPTPEARASRALPDFVRTPAPPESRPPRPLRPSAIVEDREAQPPPGPALRAAARRGTLLHQLFERLPATAPDHRRPLALRWLERSGVDADARAEIVEAALRVIEDPRFADLFTPDALAEAPIAATLADGTVVAGTVDLMRVDQDRVRIIDFKTGRSVPATAADIPASHSAQMRAYGDALRVIFPDRIIETGLLYTAGPFLIALDG